MPACQPKAVFRRVQPLVSFVPHSPGYIGEYCLKARRIPVGLLYIAALILMVVMIPLIQISSSQSSTLMHRQSSATALRIDQMKL